jgi:glycosyltransferase involved in cell wall biosynthesis
MSAVCDGSRTAFAAIGGANGSSYRLQACSRTRGDQCEYCANPRISLIVRLAVMPKPPVNGTTENERRPAVRGPSTSIVPEVAVIVPLHRLTAEARQCIETIVALNDRRAELIVVCDRSVPGLPRGLQGVRIVETGSATDTSPAEKRDAGIACTEAPICAFIDDDAYPAQDWLKRALDRFADDPTLHALGGPGVTPPKSPFRRRLAGAFYASRLGSGSLRHRFVSYPPRREVDDWPAFNFFVRTDALESVGGWASRYYGGEDTKLCLALRESGYRAAYDPQVVVYHHRRPAFVALMRQTSNVGRRRGSFVRDFPATSRRLIYFAPAGLVISMPVVCATVLRAQRHSQLAVSVLLSWAAVSTLAKREGARLDESVALPPVLVAAHGAYGLGFLVGLAGSYIRGHRR